MHGFPGVPVMIQRGFSWLEPAVFWRTMAARIRMDDGGAKDALLHAEFLGADFYRRHLKLPGGKTGAKVMEKAMQLARSHDTAYLPGCSGTYE